MTKSKRNFVFFLIGYLFFCLGMALLTLLNAMLWQNGVIDQVNDVSSVIAHLIGIGLACYIFNVGGQYNKWFYALGIVVFLMNCFFLVERLVKFEWVIKIYHRILQLFL